MIRYTSGTRYYGLSALKIPGPPKRHEMMDRILPILSSLGEQAIILACWAAVKRLDVKYHILDIL